MVDDIAAEFAGSDAPMQYATLNSQTKPDANYYGEDELSAELAALAFGNGGETMSGPTLNGDEYTVSRVADVRMMPDTLGAKHILLQKGQEKLADSLVAAIRSGADFAALALDARTGTRRVYRCRPCGQRRGRVRRGEPCRTAGGTAHLQEPSGAEGPDSYRDI